MLKYKVDFKELNWEDNNRMRADAVNRTAGPERYAD